MLWQTQKSSCIRVYLEVQMMQSALFLKEIWCITQRFSVSITAKGIIVARINTDVQETAAAADRQQVLDGS